MNVQTLRRTTDWLYLCTLVVWFLGYMWGYLNELIRPDFFCKYFLDFLRFYAAARLGMSNEAMNIYDLNTQYHWLSLVMGPMGCSMPSSYSALEKDLFFSEHPPPFLFFIMPFALIPMKPAFILNMIVCFILGGAGTAIVATRVNSLSKRQAALLIFAAAASGITAYTLQLGQPSWLILGLCAYYTYFLYRKNDVAAGILLSALTIKPQYLVFYLVPAFVLGRWRLLGIAFALCGAICGSAVLMFGLQNCLNYPLMLLGHDTHPLFQFTFVGFRGVLEWFIPRSQATIVGTGATVAGLILLIIIWQKSAKNEKNLPYALALTAVMALLFGPHNYRYDCVLLALPAALILPTVSLSQAGQVKSLCERLTYFLLMLFPMISVGLLYYLSVEKWRTVLFFLFHAVLFVFMFGAWWSQLTTNEKKT